ncbi:MAG: hypothetical protein JRG71_00710 [Deltaproteobacteria bacterium]|nr:hypothetical protein [Deltaproteobacteria bacterium]
MARICGVISMEGSSGGDGCFKELCDVSWGDVDGERQVWSNDNVALGHLALDPKAISNQPLCGEDGSRQVSSGKLVDTAGVCKQLSEKRKVPFVLGDDSALLLDLLSRERYDLLGQLNGLFTAALWQPVEKRLVLVNDRLGFRPLYYSYDVSKQRFVFSSDLRGVIAVLTNRKINWQAASVFLHLGHHLGEATWFEGVHVLPPGSILQFENNSVHIRKYWDICSIAINEFIDHEQAVDGIIETFKLSIKRRHEAASTREVVFLSGGIDSRRIAAELSSQKVKFPTYTTRGFNNLFGNRSLAAEVSDALGVSNRFVNLPENNFLTEYWPRCNDLLDYETNLHQWMLPLVDQCDDFGGVNYDGIGGDVLINAVLRTSGFLSSEGLASSREMGLNELAERLTGPALDFSFITPELRRNLSYESAVDAVKEELIKYDNDDNQLTYFYLLNRTRRNIALSPTRLISRKFECFLPYLDNDFVEFALSIPANIKVSNPLRRETLDRAYPYLMNIGNTNYQGRTDRGDGFAYDIRYNYQRRRFLYQCIRQHFCGNNWMFTNHRTVPKILKDIVMRNLHRDHISYVFSASFEVFYELLDKYFDKDFINHMGSPDV